MVDRSLYSALLRQDLLTFMQRAFRDLDPGTRFVMGWHYEAIAWQLQRVMSGEVRRLIINVPPRSGKSILATIGWPMFMWGQDPTLRMICVSHTEDLAKDFSIKRRLLAQSGWYQDLFPQMRLASARDLELRTTHTGSCFASGVGGAILGRGADVIIVDDPLKGIDAYSEATRTRVNGFFDNTLLTRLNDKTTGVIVIIMQRLHEDDLVGHVTLNGDWEVVSFPAIAVEDSEHRLGEAPGDLHRRKLGDLLMPERDTQDALDEIKRAQGSLLFNAQYQQQPIPTDGNLIRRDWLRYYEEAPRRPHRVIVSWDTASTLNEHSDWSVGVIVAQEGLTFYVLDVVRGRWEGPALRRKVLETHQRYNAAATLIEDTELGRYLAQDLYSTRELRALTLRPEGDKEARLLVQSARFEAGDVMLPSRAPWLADYIAELLAFPNGRHDDQVDATTQALNWLTDRSGHLREPLGRPNPPRRESVRR